MFMLCFQSWPQKGYEDFGTFFLNILLASGSGRSCLFIEIAMDPQELKS